MKNEHGDRMRLLSLRAKSALDQLRGAFDEQLDDIREAMSEEDAVRAWFCLGMLVSTTTQVLASAVERQQKALTIITIGEKDDG